MVVYESESWTVKNAECRKVNAFELVLEKMRESPLDCKEIQPVHPKDQSWVFIRRTDVEAENPILWLPHTKSWLVGKDPDAGRDWGQEEMGWQRMKWLDGITDSRWTWVWINSGSWWWTGRPGMLEFKGLQRVRLHWATELKYLSDSCSESSMCKRNNLKSMLLLHPLEDILTKNF